MLSTTHISLLKYISNSHDLNIHKISSKFNRTEAFLRSEIASINDFLAESEKIHIRNSQIETNLTYEKFLKFMESLDMDSYNPNMAERQQMVLLIAYFEDVVNLTKLYNSWNLSMTTRKNDIKNLETKLQKYDLKIERLPGRGIRITGDKLQYRILIVSLISICIDVYTSGIMMRRANNPIEKFMFEYFEDMTDSIFTYAYDIVDHFLLEYQININYYSRKFFLLYVILVLKYDGDDIITSKALRLSPHNFYLFDSRDENIAFNLVVSMIDFDPIIPFPYNKTLRALTIDLVKKLETYEHQNIYTKKKMVEDLYTFIYRQYFFNHFKYMYEDKLVNDITGVYPERFDFMKSSLGDIESFLEMQFNTEQINSITLIASKWFMRNQIYGNSQKRIILVTNIGYDRVNYFLESLHMYIDFKHIATVDVNELHVLDTYDYDLILSFSNRTATILNDLSHPSIKIEYFLDHDNINKLIDAGCSPAKKYIIGNDLLSKLNNKSKKKQLEYLRTVHGNIFL